MDENDSDFITYINTSGYVTVSVCHDVLICEGFGIDIKSSPHSGSHRVNSGSPSSSRKKKKQKLIIDDSHIGDMNDEDVGYDSEKKQKRQDHVNRLYIRSDKPDPSESDTRNPAIIYYPLRKRLRLKQIDMHGHSAVCLEQGDEVANRDRLWINLKSSSRFIIKNYNPNEIILLMDNRSTLTANNVRPQNLLFFGQGESRLLNITAMKELRACMVNKSRSILLVSKETNSSKIKVRDSACLEIKEIETYISKKITRESQKEEKRKIIEEKKRQEQKRQLELQQQQIRQQQEANLQQLRMRLSIGNVGEDEDNDDMGIDLDHSSDDDDDDSESDDDEYEDDGFVVVGDDTPSNTPIQRVTLNSNTQSSSTAPRSTTRTTTAAVSSSSSSSSNNNTRSNTASKPKEDGLVPSSDNDSTTNDDTKQCKICLSNAFKTVILPCFHQVLCLQCSRQLRESQGARWKCPMCRSKIERIKETFS